MFKFFALNEKIQFLEETNARLAKELNQSQARANVLEIKLEAERRRNQIRENYLLDKVLNSKGQPGIREKAEAKDEGRESGSAAKQIAERLKEERETSENLEKRAFVESSLKMGKTLAEAEEFWDKNKDEILSETL